MKVDGIIEVMIKNLFPDFVSHFFLHLAVIDFLGSHTRNFQIKKLDLQYLFATSNNQEILKARKKSNKKFQFLAGPSLSIFVMLRLKVMIT